MYFLFLNFYFFILEYKYTCVVQRSRFAKKPRARSLDSSPECEPIHHEVEIILLSLPPWAPLLGAPGTRLACLIGANMLLEVCNTNDMTHLCPKLAQACFVAAISLLAVHGCLLDKNVRCVWPWHFCVPLMWLRRRQQFYVAGRLKSDKNYKLIICFIWEGLSSTPRGYFSHGTAVASPEFNQLHSIVQ